MLLTAAPVQYIKGELTFKNSAGPNEPTLLSALHSVQLSTNKYAASAAAEPELS